MKINRQFRHRGFTLVELMGSVVISSLIFLLLFKVLDKVQTVFVASQNRARAMEQGRIAMDMLVKDFQALAAANLNDPDPFIGEVPNIDWGYDVGVVGKMEYLSPVRRFFAGNIDNDSFQVGNLRGPQIDDIFGFSHLPGVYRVVDVDLSEPRPYEFSPSITAPNTSDYPIRVEVDMNSSDPARRQLYEALSQDLYHHQCRFFTNDGGWRHVDYRFGGRGNYNQPDPASPLGALWVYRSSLVSLAVLLTEREDHKLLMEGDDPEGPLNEPLGYARALDGVVHFRVRAVSPLDPGRVLASLENSFYTGGHKPSHVEVELAVADRKLVREIEEGFEQSMEGESDSKKYQARLKYLSENLGGVYFFKQLIRIQGEEQ